MQPIITLTLNSRVISKKNSKRWIVRGGKRFLAPSEAYEKFQNDAIAQIHELFERHGGYSHLVSSSGIPIQLPYVGEVKIETIFHIKGKYKVDADNLHTSILDVLMAAKIIADDSQVVAGSYIKTPGADDWMTIVRITIL